MTNTPAASCTPDPPSPPVPPYTGSLEDQIASSLCSLGWRPILLTGFFRDSLVRHFAAPLSIENPDLRHLVWRADERTGILIESVYRWRGSLVEKRPAVIIKRNAYRNVRYFIGDRAGTTEKGFDKFLTTWVGSHTLFCIHGTGASAEILATEVQREYTQFAWAIKRDLGLLAFAVTEVGAISEVEEANEHFVVPVTIGWAYEESWQLATDSRPFRKISLRHLCGC